MPKRVENAKEALELLMRGNERFASGAPARDRQCDQTRLNVANDGQNPFCVVLSCADSRVPVEIIFDQGIGDIFTIRVAGNVIGPDQLASIEYGVDHLHIPLVIILGHSLCGAVTAVAQGGEFHGHIAQLADKIAPAVQKARQNSSEKSDAEALSHAIKLNVENAMDATLKSSSSTAEALKSGKAQLWGAYYDLHSGKVEWMDTNHIHYNIV